MKLDCTRTTGLLAIHVREPRIDAACAIEFKEAMHGITAGHDGRVLLDLSQVAFIDSSGLGAVVAVREMLGPDRVLELACLGPAVEKVLRLTRMDSIFPIHAALPDLSQQAL